MTIISTARSRRNERILRAVSVIAVIAMIATLAGLGVLWMNIRNTNGSGSATASGAGSTTTFPGGLTKTTAPTPDTTPAARARRAVAAMSMEERVGQLVMAPLSAGTAPSSLEDAIRNRHVGSVLIIGNWTNGTAGVRQATDALQSYAPANNKLLMTTDQEGGQVQHLTGAGFSTMPSATQQGGMGADQLRQSAAVWGGQLAQAGINVDLAPVIDTVTVPRASNAPIGALDRDFGLDAAGNASHATAFIQGMRDAGVQTSIKHYPGLGSVTGNTDFTADGILDTTTMLDGDTINAFGTVITDAQPGMVMMALATYQAIDPNDPAVFSSIIIDGHLRGDLGYDGVVISDSMSAAAVSAYDTTQLGVKLVEAGGDLACIGDTNYVAPILDGLSTRAASDPAFANKVTQSAIRVMTLKIKMGLA